MVIGFSKKYAFGFLAACWRSATETAPKSLLVAPDRCMYRFAIIATCAAGVERPCGYENELSTPVESAFSTNRIWTCPNRVPERSLNARYATNAFRDTRRYRDGRLLNRGAGRAAAVMDLGEELQLADAGRPRDRDLGIGVHGEGHHAVDIGRCQTRIVERIQHRLGCQPK